MSQYCEVMKYFDDPRDPTSLANEIGASFDIILSSMCPGVQDLSAVCRVEHEQHVFSTIVSLLSKLRSQKSGCMFARLGGGPGQHGNSICYMLLLLER